MADSNNEEVKEFTQTVSVEPTKDSPDEELVEEEESETPDSSSEEEKEPEAEEPEEVEESTEKESEPQEAEEPEEVKPEPKPVPGETPRERALRLETARLKAMIREQRKDELFVKKQESQTSDEDLSEYDPYDLKRLEKLVNKLGYAKKDEILSQTTTERLNDTFNEFMEAHPEYAPENDKDGLLWNQFKSEFQLYNPSKDPKTLKKILTKVHNDVYGVQPAKNLNKINASKEKIKVASHTGASAGKETKPKTQSPSGLRTDGLKGFSEEEIAELLG